jgi:hypothetical protein
VPNLRDMWVAAMRADMYDAYSRPRKVQPGCQHHLGCKCEPPYWLRPSSPIEQAKEAAMRESAYTREQRLEFMRRLSALVFCGYSDEN